MMSRILVVDDEMHVVQGLRRRLRRLQPDWEIVAAPSAFEALVHLAGGDIDVILTDLMTPGAGGDFLLEQVRQDHGDVIRIALIGSPDRRVLLRASALAQQVLVKPCPVEQIVATVERALEVRRLVMDPRLRASLGRLSNIPALPPVYRAVEEMFSRTDVEVRDVAELIARDQGLSARVLQLANSMWLALARPVESVQHAVTMLGIDITRGVVLENTVIDELAGYGSGCSMLARKLQQDGMRVVTLARTLFGRTCGAGDLFVASLLRDIGMLGLAVSSPERWRLVNERMESTGCSQVEAERQVFGVDHAAVGACLLGTWGMSVAVVEAVSMHHDPARALARGGVARAVYIADTLLGSVEPDFDMGLLAAHGLADQVPAWKEAVQELLSPAAIVKTPVEVAERNARLGGGARCSRV